MNTGNAIGFVGLGTLMWILPALAPGWFPTVGIDGSSARALWLQVMGMVQTAIGALIIFRFHGLPALTRWLASAPKLEPIWSDAPVPSAAASLLPLGIAAGISGGMHSPWMGAAKRSSGRRVALRESSAAHRMLKGGFSGDQSLVQFFVRLRQLAQQDAIHANRIASAFFGHHATESLVHVAAPGRHDREQLVDGEGLDDESMEAWRRAA